MIAPDDPRHGTYAGAIQHWKTPGDEACEPCKAAARRANKVRDLQRLRGAPPMVPLGRRAHQVVVTTPRNQLRVALGFTSHRLLDYERGGPGLMVRRASRDRLLSFQRTWTPIGVQRRLQALAVLGWSLKALSAETGINLSSLCRLRRNPDLKFVRHNVAAAVLEAWGRLHDTEAPESHSSRETRTEAFSRGWVLPFGWNDIDDPDEDPTAIGDDLYDEVVVQRALAGQRPDTTRADRVEAVRRWRATGHPVNELARITGWKPERYYAPDCEQVAS